MATFRAQVLAQKACGILPRSFSTARRQEALVENYQRGSLTEAPLFVPVHAEARAKPMSVRMTNCGSLGWVTDKERGYRYQPTPSRDWQAPGLPFPRRFWTCCANQVSGTSARNAGSLSRQFLCGPRRQVWALHQDRDENDVRCAGRLRSRLGDQLPVPCRRRFERNDPNAVVPAIERRCLCSSAGKAGWSFTASTGSILNTSTLLKNAGRINLTLRRVNP